jgi:subtilase family serine protease
MKCKNSPLIAVPLCCVMLAAVRPVQAFNEPSRRIHEDLENGRSFVLQGNRSALASPQNDLGEVDDSFEIPKITIHFRVSPLQQSDLEKLSQRQQDPSSTDYHKWLTAEQYAARFGMNTKDLQQVTNWLESRGFTNLQTARSRTWISFSGTALQIRDALSTSIHRYSVNGRQHYANASDPVLPAALQGVVEGIRGLHNFRPKPRVVTGAAKPIGLPRFTSNITGNHFIAPDDFATIYDLRPLYNNGIDGTGQKIAIAGQTDIDLADIRAFRQAASLPANDPEIVLDGKDPGTNTSDESEADLDIEWAGAVARQATIVYVNSSDTFESAIYAIDNKLAPVLSITYGSCEAQVGTPSANSLSSTFQQATVQGMTVIAASGDDGAADCDGPLDPKAPVVTTASQGLAVDIPSSIPYVTGIGGTQFNDTSGTYWSATNNANSGSALSYIPEVAWNDTSTVNGLAASGGGKSIVFVKPSWQQGLNVPNDGARDVPDVALASSPNYDGYLVCSAGSCVNGFRAADTTLTVVGGTSVASPTFAGIVALVNQQSKASQGNINPRLYSLASFTSDVFHDITQGNNQVPCKQGSKDCPAAGTLGYVAGPGYDQVTGLGSVDGYNLVNEWNSDFQVTVTPAALTVGPDRSGTATVQVSSVGDFTGTVSFTCTVPAALAKTTCSVPGTVSHSGSTTVTINNSSASSSFRLPRQGAPGSGVPWLSLAVTCLLIAGSYIVIFPGRRNQALLFGMVIALMIVVASCGDGSSSSSNETPTPSVTAPVSITATSGIESHVATLSVTAQ